MYRQFYKYILTMLTFINFIEGTKWLIDNPGFNDPSSWVHEHMPCGKEFVIFPQTYQALLPLPKNVDVGGFILPQDGALLLSQETIITMGSDSRERDCDNINAILKDPTVHKWFDPNTWRSSKERETNMAIPDMERVPCNNESVVIQSNGALVFDLEYTPYLRLGQLSFAGSLLSKDYLKELLYTDLGQYLFRNQEGVNVEFYHNDVCGCHKDFNTFNEPICHNIINTCPRPHCLVAIVPFGSCCAICGSVLRFAVEYCEKEKLHLLEDIIKKGLKEKSLEEDLYFYVNFINSNTYGNYLQAIIVDRDSYNEKSVKFMKYLNETTNWTNLLRHGLKFYGLESSGKPYNPNITFGSVLLILLCIIFVSIVALVIFALYKPDNRYLHYIPRWTYYARLWRAFVNRPNNVFARFDNTRASIQTISVESNIRRHFSMGYDQDGGSVREQAFNNPMFGELASTSHAAPDESKEKKVDITQNAPQLVIESIDIIDSSEREEEEQELTEIKLNSSSDEDEDLETNQ